MSTILTDTPTGLLWQNGGNETVQDSKVPDASKFRVGAPFVPGQSGGGGAISFDDLPEGAGPGKPRIEFINLNGGRMANGGGELNLSILKPNAPISDENQIKVAEFRSDGVEFKVPVTAPNLSGGAVLSSPDGRLQLIAQGDHNLVLYMDGTPIRALFGLGPEQVW